MSTEMLESEIANLKKRVAALESGQSPKRSRDWVRAVGALKDADLLDEAVRLGREIREQANQEGR